LNPIFADFHPTNLEFSPVKKQPIEIRSKTKIYFHMLLFGTIFAEAKIKFAWVADLP
jgi:hypothetical protein